MPCRLAIRPTFATYCTLQGAISFVGSYKKISDFDDFALLDSPSPIQNETRLSHDSREMQMVGHQLNSYQ